MNTANNIIVVTYLTYLLISVALTIWVARTLYKRGGIFLIDAFHGNRNWPTPSIICWWWGST